MRPAIQPVIIGHCSVCGNPVPAGEHLYRIPGDGNLWICESCDDETETDCVDNVCQICESEPVVDYAMLRPSEVESEQRTAIGENCLEKIGGRR